jgi:hypothetical protein
MGKRSRKRSAAPGANVSATGTSRAERDAARRRRAQSSGARAQSRGSSARGSSSGSSSRPGRRGRPGLDERPPPPWGSFPLDILVILLALGLFVGGLVVGGDRGQVMLTGALVLGSLAGLELALREHLAGYRSHTTLLAAVCAFIAMAITYFAAGKGDVARALLLPVAGIVFMGSLWYLRELFRRRSGGLGFR